jgi:3-hydroxybutyrate dehydrogenase
MRLEGRKALVTGGASGIGAAVADALLDEGAGVFVSGRNGEKLAAFAETRPRCTPLPFDVTDEAAVEAAFDAAFAGGPLSILIANAGAAETAPLKRTGLDAWERMLAVNLTGPFLCTRAFLRRVDKDAEGRIVAIASTAALKGYAFTAAYTAAKHGVLGLVRAVALELAESRITANAVCPGFTNTPMLEASIINIIEKTGRSAVEAAAELSRFNPQGRLIEPAEAAAAVLSLCLPEARSINGQAIAVDGGETAS